MAGRRVRRSPESHISGFLESQLRIPQAWVEARGSGGAPGYAVYRGDCREVLDALPAGCVDCVFADPPYRLNKATGQWFGRSKETGTPVGWDRSEGAFSDWSFHLGWLAACRRVLKPSGTLWVSGTYHASPWYAMSLKQLGFHVLSEVVWVKPAPPPNVSCRSFTAAHETLLWARKDPRIPHTFNYRTMKHHPWVRDTLNRPGRQMRSVWLIAPPSAADKTYGRHPTQKPLELLSRVVLASTNPGDLVLDPFTGSGTTGVAALLAGRSFIGIEREKGYLEIALRRLQAATEERPAVARRRVQGLSAQAEAVRGTARFRRVA